MMEQIYERMLADAKSHNKDSFLYKHHIEYIKDMTKYYSTVDYEDNDPNDIVVDYIASMTDDYFVDLYRYLFPDGKYDVKYVGYFE
jgi:dGTPase